MSRERPPRDLVPLIAEWPKEQLRALRELITATERERAEVAAWIRGRIEK
jgi:hypothetical protein